MKKEYISAKIEIITIEPAAILAGSLLNEQKDVQDVEINTQEVLDTESSNWVVW